MNKLETVKNLAFRAKVSADEFAPLIVRLPIYKEAVRAFNKMLNQSLSHSVRCVEGDKAYRKFLEARFWQYYKNCGNTPVVVY